MEKRRQKVLKATATSASSSAHTGCSQRLTKPTLQVYRPPGARLAEMQCKQNEVNTTTDGNVVAHPKPRLDHSEVPDVLARQTLSLTHDQPEPASNGPQSQSDYEQGKDKGVMYYSLVKQAANDPTLLNLEQLEGVACTVCYTAAQSIGHAEPVAVLCLEIALASNGAFLEALSKSCCELFEKREELMGTLEVTTHLLLRWTPYVTFLAELLALFELWYSSGANAAAADVCGGEMLSGCWKKAVQSLAILLSSCFHVILRPPSLGSFDEMACLKLAMKATGKTIERVAPHLMRTLMARLRTAYLEPGITAHTREILFELIELRASRWQLKSST